MSEVNGLTKESLEYRIGIIDILTCFSFTKKLEAFSKKCWQGKDVSCVPPKNYAERFNRFFIQSIISSKDDISQPKKFSKKETILKVPLSNKNF